MILSIVGVPTVQIRLETELLHEEFDDLVLRPLKVCRIVILSYLDLDLLYSDRVVDVQALLKLLNCLCEKILLDLKLCELEM